jgi:hypothetical protein
MIADWALILVSLYGGSPVWETIGVFPTPRACFSDYNGLSLKLQDPLWVSGDLLQPSETEDGEWDFLRPGREPGE